MAWYISTLIFIWDSFKLWLHNIFVAPFTNLDALWILVPIYLGLIFAEFFQEKHGTSIGNAMSNSIIVCWGGIDFLRTTIKGIGAHKFNFLFYERIAIALVIIAYGIIIIVNGIKAKEIVKHIGRVREVSYCVIIFIPLYYTNATITWEYVTGTILFFPLFYLALYIIDRFIPDPEALTADEGWK